MDGLVKSADRVLTLAAVLADNPKGLTFTDLAGYVKIPKSSLHQLLNTLVTRYFVTYDDDSQTYTLGPKFWELAMGYLRRFDVVQVGRPFLEVLGRMAQETVQLGVLDHADVVYLAKIESSHAIQLVSHVGARLPAFATGIGKALLATLADAKLEEMYPSDPLPRFTPYTLPTREALRKDLEQTRIEGYARDQGEYSSHVRCVAAPIVDYAGRGVAAVSLSIPVERYNEQRKEEIVVLLRQCVIQLSSHLGAANPDVWRRMGPTLALPGSEGVARGMFTRH